MQTSGRYYPQKATRDALAQFIGYRDWQEFEVVYKAQLQDKMRQLPQEMDGKVLSGLSIGTGNKTNRIILLIAMMMILAIGSLFWLKKSSPAAVKLICVNPYGGVPYSAVFKLGSKTAFDQDEVFEIDFLEEALRSTISGKKQVTKFFKNPGVVYATLLLKGKPLDTATIYMQTKGWVANSGNDTSGAYPVIGLRALNPKHIYVSNSQLDSAGLNTSKPFMVGFSNIKPSNISGDNFTFSCRIFSERSRPGIACVGTAMLILGSKDKHVVNLFRENCAAFCDYKFSEVRVLGTDKDLHALAFDPLNGGNVVMEVKNKLVSVFLDGKLALRTRYIKPIGKVMGLKIVFNGIGKVISPSLRDLNTGETF